MDLIAQLKAGDSSGRITAIHILLITTCGSWDLILNNLLNSACTGSTFSWKRKEDDSLGLALPDLLSSFSLLLFDPPAEFLSVIYDEVWVIFRWSEIRTAICRESKPYFRPAWLARLSVINSSIFIGAIGRLPHPVVPVTSAGEEWDTVRAPGRGLFVTGSFTDAEGAILPIEVSPVLVSVTSEAFEPVETRPGIVGAARRPRGVDGGAWGLKFFSLSASRTDRTLFRRCDNCGEVWQVVKT